MVLSIIPAATMVLISGLIRLIAYLASIVFVAMYVRDTVTATKEADVQISQDKTIDDIIDSTTLTPEQKTELLKQYIEKTTGETDWGKIALYIGLAASVIYIASQVLGGKK